MPEMTFTESGPFAQYWKPGKGTIPPEQITYAVRAVKRNELIEEIAAVDAERVALDQAPKKPTPAQKRKLTIRRNALVRELEVVEAKLAAGWHP